MIVIPACYQTMAQPVPVSCQEMLEQAKVAIKAEHFEPALTKLRAAKACSAAKETEINQLIVKVFKGIERQRDNAIRQQKIAEDQTFIASMEGIAASAAAQRYQDPTVAAQLAAYSYQRLPSKNSSRGLHDILSDTNAFFYQKQVGKLSPGVPLAINDEKGAVVQAMGISIYLTDIKTGITSYVSAPGNQIVYIRRAGISLDGLLVAFCDESFNIWLAHPFENRMQSVMHAEQIPEHIFVSDKKNLIALYTKGKGFTLIDTAGNVHDTIKETREVFECTFSKNEEWFSYGGSRFFVLYNLKNKKQVFDSAVSSFSLDFSASNKLTRMDAGRLNVYHVTDSSVQKEREYTFLSSFSACRFAGKTDDLYCLSMDRKTIARLDLTGRIKQLSMIGSDQATIHSFAVSEQDSSLVCVSSEKSILWRLNRPLNITKINIVPDRNRSFGTRYITAEKNIAVKEYINGAANAAIKLVDDQLSTIRVLDSLPAAQYEHDFLVSPLQNRTIAFYGGYFIITDMATRKQIRYAAPWMHMSTRFAVSPDFTIIAAVKADTLYRYSINNQTEQTLKLKKYFNYTAFFKDSMLLTDYDNNVYIASKEGKIKRRFTVAPFSHISRIYSSPDAEYVFLGSSDFTNSVYPLTICDHNGFLLKTYYVPFYYKTITVSADKKKFYLLSADGVLEEPMPLSILESLAPLSMYDKMRFHIEKPLAAADGGSSANEAIEIIDFLLGEYENYPTAANLTLIKQAYENIKIKLKNPKGGEDGFLIPILADKWRKSDNDIVNEYGKKMELLVK